MEPAMVTAIVQAVVTVISTLSGVWAIFNKQNEKIISENSLLRAQLHKEKMLNENYRANKN